ncbi:hypothetical protein Bamy01_19230 [Bacillus amyloliquefaciens]|nr:hypothetical protein Bamy01_19230 [Bacillus amyloliquefaciens]
MSQSRIDDGDTKHDFENLGIAHWSHSAFLQTEQFVRPAPIIKRKFPPIVGDNLSQSKDMICSSEIPIRTGNLELNFEFSKICQNPEVVFDILRAQLCAF